MKYKHKTQEFKEWENQYVEESAESVEEENSESYYSETQSSISEVSSELSEVSSEYIDDEESTESVEDLSDSDNSTDMEIYLQPNYQEKFRPRPYNLDNVIAELKLRNKGNEIDPYLFIYVHDELCPAIRKYHERKNRYWIRKIYNYYFGVNKKI